MPFKKILFCNCICLFYVSAIIAQVYTIRTERICNMVIYVSEPQFPDIVKDSLPNSKLHQHDSMWSVKNSLLLKENTSVIKNPLVRKLNISEMIMSNNPKNVLRIDIYTPRIYGGPDPIKERLILGSEFVEKGPVIFVLTSTHF